VTVDVAPDVHVVADRDHLEQMLVNYVSNAIKYGELPITVSSRPHGDAYVDVLVLDQGDGVPDDVQPLLFEEFVRGRGHAAARIPGTGLGLSIVRGLARAQGGDAWHEPNEPNGSIFALRLPSPLA
jgi:signal transduction histidine kinase